MRCRYILAFGLCFFVCLRHILFRERGPGRDPGLGRHGPRRAAAPRERERAAPELSVLLPRGDNVVRDITSILLIAPGHGLQLVSCCVCLEAFAARSQTGASCGALLKVSTQGVVSMA